MALLFVVLFLLFGVLVNAVIGGVKEVVAAFDAILVEAEFGVNPRGGIRSKPPTRCSWCRWPVRSFRH